MLLLECFKVTKPKSIISSNSTMANDIYIRDDSDLMPASLSDLGLKSCLPRDCLTILGR